MTTDANSELQYVIIEALILVYIIIISHFNFNDVVHNSFKSKSVLRHTVLKQLSRTNLTIFDYVILVIDVIMFNS